MTKSELGLMLFLYESTHSTYKKLARKRKPDSLDGYVKDNYKKNLNKMQRFLKKRGFKGEFNTL